MSSPLVELFLKKRIWILSLLSLITLLTFSLYYYYSRCKCYNTKDLKIISRENWGAVDMNVTTSDERGIYDEIKNPSGILRYKQPLKGFFTAIVIHHSALSSDLGADYIQNLHMREQKFADIGYHYVVDRQGRVYEGRNIGMRGAHVAGNNTGTIGVVLLGNFQDSFPPDCQSHALVSLLQRLKSLYQVESLTTHICYNPNGTLCPGKNLISKMNQIASETNMNYLKD